MTSPLSSPQDRERAEFEEVCPKGLPAFWDIEKRRYISIHTQWTFEVWQAARQRAESSRKHTQDWYASHYGKVEDWARRRLPEPWRTEYFSCVANGTWGHDDTAEPYMTQVGRVVPSGYIKFDTAQEQILHDQTTRAEEAEAARCEERKRTLEECARIVENAPLFWIGGAVNRREVAAEIRALKGEANGREQE